MENITVKINGVEISVPKGTTVLEAAHTAGFEIPTLCYMKEINEIGACRICITEVNEGRGFRLVAGCVYPCSDNMEILTNSPKVIESRKKTLELILSTHDRKCLSCVRSGNCELQKLAFDYGVDEDRFKGDDVVYVAVNTYWEELTFSLPEVPDYSQLEWFCAVDTFNEEPVIKGKGAVRGKIKIAPRSVKVFFMAYNT